MHESIKLGVRLILITLVAGLALGMTYAVTKEPIQKQVEEKERAARQAVLLADTYEERPLEALQASDGWTDAFAQSLTSMHDAYQDGEYVGSTFVVGARGYGGTVSLMVGIRADGTVAGVQPISNSETKGIGEKALQASHLDAFLGQQAADTQPIDAISGATVTSRAVQSGVDTAKQAFLAFAGEGQE